ncbi:MAG TPA: hypothetical protein VE868_09030 [Balneolaceae bacterium]|nr:hypothetical protein [Balneolaceae bacterium]
MIKFFRIQPSEESGFRWKYIMLGVILVALIGSFILQISLGHCPVP